MYPAGFVFCIFYILHESINNVFSFLASTFPRCRDGLSKFHCHIAFTGLYSLPSFNSGITKIAQTGCFWMGLRAYTYLIHYVVVCTN